MAFREFRQTGHFPTLVCSFLYMAFGFMCWFLLGGLANFIVPELKLSTLEKSWLVATPILAGSIIRLFFGFMADLIGSKRTAMIGLVLTTIPLLWGWLGADSLPTLLMVGVLLGIAGASFSVAVPLGGRWYPPQTQGLAVGLISVGNGGTALATFFGPMLARQWGWHAVFGLSLIPTLVTLVLVAIFARDCPSQAKVPSTADRLRVLGHKDMWWLSLFYSITFGGFAGLASYLGIFFFEQYGSDGITPEFAGFMTTIGVVAGSFLRPLGGYLATHWGGTYLVLRLYAIVGLLLLGLAAIPPLPWTVLILALIMGALGIGNGAIFQMVPLRFPRDFGVASGLIGAAGGLGGFLLPLLLGTCKKWTEGFGTGFVVLSGIALFGMVALLYISRSWEKAFLPQASEPAPKLAEAAAGAD